MWETGWKFTFSTDDELEDHNLWLCGERFPCFLDPDGNPDYDAARDLFYCNLNIIGK
jgi:hypothetical protein